MFCPLGSTQPLCVSLPVGELLLSSIAHALSRHSTACIARGWIKWTRAHNAVEKRTAALAASRAIGGGALAGCAATLLAAQSRATSCIAAWQKWRAFVIHLSCAEGTRHASARVALASQVTLRVRRLITLRGVVRHFRLRCAPRLACARALAVWRGRVALGARPLGDSEGETGLLHLPSPRLIECALRAACLHPLAPLVANVEAARAELAQQVSIAGNRVSSYLTYHSSIYFCFLYL